MAPPNRQPSPALPSGPPRILVIKLGALGDVLVTLGPLRAIRRHHPDAEITALTTAPFAELLRRSGLVDRVWIDTRPRWWQLGAFMRLRRRLIDAGFRRVYDLQTNDRTALYFRLFDPLQRPEWSGVARGCSHPHDNPARRSLHAFERMGEQLRAAGIAAVPMPDLGWLDADTARLGLRDPFVLLVPGSAPTRPEKRWPAAQYAALAKALAGQGITPVLIGTVAEREPLDAVAAACPPARNLTGETSLDELAALARRAVGAVGNDTGPMHLIALTGCPSLVLFGRASDPARHRPLGADVGILQAPRIAEIGVDAALAALRRRPPPPPSGAN